MATRRPSMYSRGTFEVHNGHASDDEIWVVVGNIPELGNWDACRGLKLERHGDHVWKAPGIIYNAWNSVGVFG